jgi:hypothetical protein
MAPSVYITRFVIHGIKPNTKDEAPCYNSASIALGFPGNGKKDVVIWFRNLILTGA